MRSRLQNVLLLLLRMHSRPSWGASSSLSIKFANFFLKFELSPDTSSSFFELSSYHRTPDPPERTRHASVAVPKHESEKR